MWLLFFQLWSVQRERPSRTALPWRTSSSALMLFHWRKSRPTTAGSGTCFTLHYCSSLAFLALKMCFTSRGEFTLWCCITSRNCTLYITYVKVKLSRSELNHVSRGVLEQFPHERTGFSYIYSKMTVVLFLK